MLLKVLFVSSDQNMLMDNTRLSSLKIISHDFTASEKRAYAAFQLTQSEINMFDISGSSAGTCCEAVLLE